MSKRKVTEIKPAALVGRKRPKRESQVLTKPVPTAAATTSSSKDVPAALALLPQYLGTKAPPIGGQVKGGAMSLLANGHTSQKNKTYNVVFNKMSGIQEFKNCVALFVNVGGNDYDNVFAIGHDQDANKPVLLMSWFAQSTQSMHTTVIQRLLKANRYVYYIYHESPSLAVITEGSPSLSLRTLVLFYSFPQICSPGHAWKYTEKRAQERVNEE